MNTTQNTKRASAKVSNSPSGKVSFEMPASSAYYDSILAKCEEIGDLAFFTLEYHPYGREEDILAICLAGSYDLDDKMTGSERKKRVRSIAVVNCEKLNSPVGKVIVYRDPENSFALTQLSNGTVVVYATTEVASLVSTLWKQRSLFTDNGFTVKAVSDYAKKFFMPMPYNGTPSTPPSAWSGAAQFGQPSPRQRQPSADVQIPMILF